jgi:hypothetical protein
MEDLSQICLFVVEYLDETFQPGDPARQDYDDSVEEFEEVQEAGTPGRVSGAINAHPNTLVDLIHMTSGELSILNFMIGNLINQFPIEEEHQEAAIERHPRLISILGAANLFVGLLKIDPASPLAPGDQARVLIEKSFLRPDLIPANPPPVIDGQRIIGCFRWFAFGFTAVAPSAAAVAPAAEPAPATADGAAPMAVADVTAPQTALQTAAQLFPWRLTFFRNGGSGGDR